MTAPLKLSSRLINELASRNLELIRATDVDGFLDKADVVSIPSWPEFMMHDSVANKYWGALNEQHSDFQYALIDQTTQKWVAVGNSIPVSFSESLERLPDAGWDWALLSGVEASDPPNLLCALAIQILPEFRGGGLSTLMIEIMKEIGQHFGLNQLIAPVRPNKKCDYPLIQMEIYIEWSRAGEKFDPWLRVHERLGARILKVCPQAMEISGTVHEWQEWTGLVFQASGQYIVPGALNPITINVENDHGVYIEPNVWMLHS